MMSNSIFNFIKSYIPTDKRDAQENYLTKMFAWMLDNIRPFAIDYIRLLYEKNNKIKPLNDISDIKVSTQETISSGEIDLLLRVNDTIAFICEHKVWSPLSKNQIAKYMENSKELGDKYNYYSVLLTAGLNQQTQDADVKIVWGDVHELIKNKIDSYDEKNKVFLEQFMFYLEENGLAKSEAITNEALFSYWKVQQLYESLFGFFNQLLHEIPNLCKSDIKGIEAFGCPENYKPSFNRSRWGRCGIDFFDEWNSTGLFAGVLLNKDDHKIEPLDARKGPELMIIIDVDNNNKESYRNFINSDRSKQIEKNLENEHGDFNLILHKDLKNKCRYAVLRKSLFDILYKKYTVDEQYSAIKNEIVRGVNFIIKSAEV